MGTPFVWFDLAVRDADAVGRFYGELLGWSVAPDPSPDAPYAAWIGDGPQPWAAVAATGADGPGQWIPYIQVDDLDDAAVRAEKLGASIVQGRTTGPAGDAVLVADPAGAVVALWVPAETPASS